MQLTRPDNVTKNKIIFNDAKEYKVRDSKIKYKRIKIETVYLNSKKGDLVIETPFLFSFGVNENKSQETNKLVGYSIPVCLWEKDCSPSSPEKQFYEFICKMVEVCKEHLEEEYGEIWHHLCLSHYITNRLSIQTRKEKRKLKETSQPRQYFMLNLFTLTKQRKFFLCLEQRENKK